LQSAIGNLQSAIRGLLLPCPWHVRALGFPRELRNIRRRYQRFRSAWEPHCQRTRDVLRTAVSRTHRRRKAILLGTGYLHDIPLDELAAAFETVVLVDVLHPFATRWAVRTRRNVHLLEADVTGTLREVWQAAGNARVSLPSSEPRLFLDDSEVDLIASVNLLSQLPCLPERYLLDAGAHPPDAIHAWARSVISAHLAWLQKFPAVVPVIADIEVATVDPSGQVVRRSNTLYGLPPPFTGSSWTWTLVPRAALPPYHATHLHVLATPDLHAQPVGGGHNPPPPILPAGT
jgi:hypothetical protein